MAERVAARQPAPTHRVDPQRSVAHAAQLGSRPSGRGISRLQRAVGNRAIGRLLRSRTIQTKLTVGPPDDEYEREADRVADEVMRMPEPAAGMAVQRAPLTIQRLCSECEEKEEELQRTPIVAQRLCPGCEKEKLQHTPSAIQRMCPQCREELQRQAAAGHAVHVPLSRKSATDEAERDEEDAGIVQAASRNVDPAEPSSQLASYVAGSRGGGSPLPLTTRAQFEGRFGHDFSNVRIHADVRSAAAAVEINSYAFATGADIHFGSGRFQPGTPQGDHLLAHELTHTIQQTGGRPLPTRGAATRVTTAMAAGDGISRSREHHLQRKPGGGFESTIKVCHQVLESRTFKVTQGGVRVVLILRPLDQNVPNCRDFKFGVTLTKSVDWGFDDEIGTCGAVTGGVRSFSFANLTSGSYYLTIWRSFDHPYCCLEGDILVIDEPVSADSTGCIRDKDPSVMDIVHGALDLAGFIPVVGAIPDGVNALIYAAEGDWTNAGISAVAMVPAFGDGAKLAFKGGKEVVEASGKSIIKMGKEDLGRGLKQIAEERAAKEAAEKAAKEAADKAAKEATEKAAKEKAEKITECLTIWGSYKALNCKGCGASKTKSEAQANIACLSAEIAGRELYLKRKCDYFLPGSIARGSAIAEAGHKTQAAEKRNALARCIAKLATLPN